MREIISTILDAVLLMFLVLIPYVWIRAQWLMRQHKKWFDWAADCDRDAIRRANFEDPLKREYIQNEIQARTHALMSVNHCMLKVFTWNLKGLVADQRRYSEVVEFLERRKQELH